MTDTGREPSRVFLRKDLTAAGFVSNEIRRAERDGSLERVRWGAYAKPADHQRFTADIYRDRIEAVARRSPQLVVSHLSAAIMYGAPLWRGNTEIVHLTRPPGGGWRASADRLVHSATLAPQDICQAGGMLLTSPARTLVDVAATASLATTMVIGDWMVHQRLVDPAAVGEVLDRYQRRRGRAACLRALSAVDGRSESPGESVTRWLLRSMGVAGLESQVEILDRSGAFLARADLGLIDEATVFEFDGRGKYVATDGSANVKAVMAEKRREDGIRATGPVVVRLDWGDVKAPTAFATRVEQARSIGRRTVAAGLVTCRFVTTPPRPALPIQYREKLSEEVLLDLPIFGSHHAG